MVNILRANSFVPSRVSVSLHFDNLQIVHMRSILFALSVAIGFSANAQSLYINEVMASNRTTIPDNFLEFDDWVEIYNAGAEFDLAGYYLSDNPDNLIKWQFPFDQPEFTVIPAGGHRIFWCDNQPLQGPDHVTFRLSADGEFVILVDPDGETIIDFIEFAEQQSDISYGRTCDGCPDWTYFNVPTPEAPNAQTPVPTQILFINEVMTVNTTNPFWVDEYGETDRWFEVYNPNPYQVNLAGYYVSVSSANPLQYQFPNTNPVRTTVPANGFMIFWGDNQAWQGPNHMNFTLPLSGTVTLRGPDQTNVNSFTYPSLTPNTSHGRTTDGGLGNSTFTAPTPRASNTIQIIPPANLFINELLARNQADTTDTVGDFEDWFEIYNPNNFAVDLAGYYISDNPDRPKKWQVPTTSGNFAVIPALGYKLFWADSDQDHAWNHTNFRLDGNLGEWLILRSPDGFSIADQINWGYQRPDTSLGRLTDGNLPWVNFAETTPERSNNGAIVRVPEMNRPVAEIYPNPVMRGNPVNFNGRYRFEVYTTSGQRVGQGESVDYMNTSALAPGMYIVVLDNFYRMKLLVRA